MLHIYHRRVHGKKRYYRNECISNCILINGPMLLSQIKALNNAENENMTRYMSNLIKIRKPIVTNKIVDEAIVTNLVV